MIKLWLTHTDVAVWSLCKYISHHMPYNEFECRIERWRDDDDPIGKFRCCIVFNDPQEELIFKLKLTPKDIRILSVK